MPYRDLSGNGSSSSNGSGFGQPSVPQPGSNPSGQGLDPTEMLINYNDRCKGADPAMFRDDVISQTMSVLIGKNKPNPLLVGPAGVGKTRIVEEIARRIATSDPTVPDQIAGCTVWELPLANVVAGSGVVGDLEEKTKAIVEFACEPKNKCILFIDEVHQLSDGSQIYTKIAQILKPAMARGDMHLIGATTLQEARDFADDPALNRRFSRIIVDEFTREQTIEVLRAVMGQLAVHYHGMVITSDDTLATVAADADQYATAGGHRPDTAITLLDRAMADAVVHRKEAISKTSDPMVAKQLASTPIPLGDAQVRRTAMRLMTGHAKRADIDREGLEQAFSHILGQSQVIDAVIPALLRDGLDLFPKRKPLSMLFAGPSGVGKTAVARVIGEQLTSTTPITLNMAEFHSSASINRIIGSPAGYVGSDSNAELPFDVLESNPYQVILLDEFEKADRSVQRLFMSALDDGVMRTSRGKDVDFSKAIVIATTNATHTTAASHSMGFAEADASESDKRRSTVDALSGWFDTELLNRFGHVMTFNRIDRDTYAAIVADTWRLEVRRIKSERGAKQLTDDISDETLADIVERTYVPDFGARPANAAVQEAILDVMMP